MNAKVCVNCGNKNPVNGIDNRLVTESCGHVKCMQCLLLETTGCDACKKNNGHKDFDSIEVSGNGVKSTGEETDPSETLLDVTKGSHGINNTKLEISHITVESDASAKRYTCTICKKKFNARSQVKYHAYCNGQPKPFPCPSCNESFVTHSHFEYHMRRHLEDRRFACEFCDKTFMQKSNLQRHRLRHTKERNHPCKQCGKTFNNRSALRKHTLLHTDERPYRCKTCGLKFRDSSNYRKHVKKHEREKYTCATCGRATVTTRACADHAPAPEERKYKCPQPDCTQAFYLRKDLRRHEQVHTDTKPYACTTCPGRFRRKDNLDRHMRTTHGEREPDAAPAPAATQKKVSVKPDDPPNNTREEECEKAKLEELNPLPPLPEAELQKHLYTQKSQVKERQKEEPIMDKTSIMEANNARESVIVGNFLDRKIASPIPEYVHKIRKANSLSCRRQVPLPPMDERKFIELAAKDRNNLDIGPLPKNIQPYKNILEEEKVPEVHWKKRLNDNE
ncbi:zinc finger protein 300-like isoform X2 [Pectinophora gossypiella]|uniref:zinc finger protein 300-like isoform X2 n=1 Tax=Pectinophora gossypiella TaxID=13191 RepID=UPI00214EC7DC|nr:zinc finger protein 300-like isoform X2 [Pectinophora gossypiella]